MNNRLLLYSSYVHRALLISHELLSVYSCRTHFPAVRHASAQQHTFRSIPLRRIYFNDDFTCFEL